MLKEANKMKNFLLKEIVVWLLIFIGLVVFSVFVYIIGSNKSHIFNSFITYKTVLNESSGIHVGTKVTIHGKNTGNVVKTVLLSDGRVEIHFAVKKNHTFILTQSSFIQLKTAGVLGDRFVNIVTEDLSAQRLKKGSLIPYKKTSTLLSLLTGGEKDERQSVRNLIEQVGGLIGQFNKKKFGILSKSQEEDLTQILKSSKEILKKIESGQGTLGALINDRSLYNKLIVLLGQRPTHNYLQDLSKKSQKQKE